MLLSPLSTYSIIKWSVQVCYTTMFIYKQGAGHVSLSIYPSTHNIYSLVQNRQLSCTIVKIITVFVSHATHGMRLFTPNAVKDWHIHFSLFIKPQLKVDQITFWKITSDRELLRCGIHRKKNFRQHTRWTIQSKLQNYSSNFNFCIII